MEYKEFVEYIKMNAGYIAGEGGNITINHVIKNNGCEMDGLVIMEKGKDIAPTIYLDSFYELYTNGENIKNIIRQIEVIYEQNKNNVTFDVNILKHFDTIKDKIVYKVVNYRSNEKLLEQVPHKRILDLAVVFYCLLDNEYGRSATALIYNNNLKNWNVTIDDVYKAALKNTPDLLHSKISSMAALFEKCGVNVDGEEVDLKDYVPSDMYVSLMKRSSTVQHAFFMRMYYMILHRSLVRICIYCLHQCMRLYFFLSFRCLRKMNLLIW